MNKYTPLYNGIVLHCEVAVCVVGALTGYSYCSKNKWEGTIIGSSVGGLVGFLSGITSRYSLPLFIGTGTYLIMNNIVDKRNRPVSDGK